MRLRFSCTCKFCEVRPWGCENACQGIWIRWSAGAGAVLACLQDLIQVRLSTTVKGCSQNRHFWYSALMICDTRAIWTQLPCVNPHHEHACKPPSLPEESQSWLEWRRWTHCLSSAFAHDLTLITLQYSALLFLSNKSCLKESSQIFTATTQVDR